MESNNLADKVSVKINYDFIYGVKERFTECDFIIHYYEFLFLLLLNVTFYENKKYY